ncbi:MAG: tail fiber domain-containing protein [archaeon]
MNLINTKIIGIITLIIIVTILSGCVNSDLTVPGPNSSCTTDTDCDEGYACTNGVCSATMGLNPPSSPVYIPNEGNEDVVRGDKFESTASQGGAIGKNSVAFGRETTTEGDYSIATGWKTTTTGDSSTAMGTNTTAIGDNSTALGRETTASGNVSIATGRETIASGAHSTAMGRSTIAEGAHSTALGWRTTAKGTASTTMGLDTTASGDYSIATGYKSSAYGKFSTAMGNNTKASGESSTVIGSNITVSGDYSVGIGLYRTAYNKVLENDNTMAIMGGKVGIGTVSPTAVLEIEETAIQGDILKLTDYDGSCSANPNAGELVWTCSSDAKLKSNISEAEPTLSYLSSMPVRDYTVKASGDRMTGFIAQELQKTHPELVSVGSDGTLMVSSLPQAKLIKAIQELKAENDALKALVCLDHPNAEACN